MAKLPTAFDSRTVEPQASFEPVPAGLYTVEITGADVKPVNNGTGLNLEFTVIDPEQYAKRKVWALLCIQHSNPQTEQIAQSQLSAICRAVNLPVLDDSDALFGKILRIRTKIRPAQSGKDGKHYDARSEVQAYEAAGGPLPAANAPTAAQAPAASSAAVPPWKKRAA